MQLNLVEQSLLAGLKEILGTSELKTFEKMILVVIRVFQAEHESAFPDYDTIAAAGGMCKRKAQYVVKDLMSRNMLDKKPRYKDLSDGSRKQTSNLYKTNELASSPKPDVSNSMHTMQDAHSAPAQTAPNFSFRASDAPYKESSLNQDSLYLFPSTFLNHEEEDYIKRERLLESQKYACYADVYEKMVQFQGTGVLCFHQAEFLDCSKMYGLPKCIVSELYPHIENQIQQYHFKSINRTIEKFAERLRRKRIDNPISWFIATFKNENLLVRSEIELERTGNVS